MKVYTLIEDVLKTQDKMLAPHEFIYVSMPAQGEDVCNAREYVGCTEATLARRMREMVVAGRLISQKRAGKTFKEFGLAIPQPELI